MSPPSNVASDDDSIHSLITGNDSEEELDDSQISLGKDNKSSSRDDPIDRGSFIAAAMDQLEASITSLGNNTFDTDDYLGGDDESGSEEEKDLRNSDIFLKKDFEVEAETDLENSQKELSAETGRSPRRSIEKEVNSKVAQASNSVSPTSTRRRRKSESSLTKSNLIRPSPESDEQESLNTVAEFHALEDEGDAVSQDEGRKDKPTRRKRRSSVESRRSTSKTTARTSSKPRSSSHRPESSTRSKSPRRSRSKAKEHRRGESRTRGSATDRSVSPNRRVRKSSNNRRRKDASISPKRKPDRNISRRQRDGSKSPRRQRRLEKGEAGRELSSYNKSKHLDRSHQSHIRRKEEHRKREKRNIRRCRSNAEEMGASVGNVISVQDDPIRRRRNRRARGNAPDQLASRLSASLSTLEFEPNDTSSILPKETHRPPQDVLESSDDNKILDISPEVTGEIDENQKKKKRGVMATIKKKLNITSAKKDIDTKDTEKAAAPPTNTDEVVVRSPGQSSDEMAQMVDETITTGSDIIKSEGECATPNRQRRRPSGSNLPHFEETSKSVRPPVEKEDNDAKSARNILAAAAAARAKELDLVEDEERQNRRRQRKETAKAAAAAAQNLRSQMPGDEDDEDAPRRRKKRGEASVVAAAARARARARREGLRAGEANGTINRTPSHSAASEAAARARIRARKKGISLSGDDSRVLHEEDEDTRRQRRLRDGAMIAATSEAKAKLRARDLVRNISTDAAEAAAKRVVLTGQGLKNQPVLPALLQRQLAGEEPIPVLRKVRNGGRRKKPTRTRSHSPGHEYSRHKGFEPNSVDESDTGHPSSTEVLGADNELLTVLPPENKRVLTEEEKLSARRQRSRGDTDAMNSSRQTLRRRKPQRHRSAGSTALSNSDGSVRSEDIIEDTKVVMNSPLESVPGGDEDSDRRPSAVQFDPKQKNHLSVLPMGHNDGSLSITSGHTAPAALSNSRKSRDSEGAQSMLGGAEFGGDEDDDLMFADLDSGPEMDGNKSSASLMPGAVKWIRKKTKRATKKLLTKAVGKSEGGDVEGEKRADGSL